MEQTGPFFLLPGLVWSTEGRPCSMSVLDVAGFWVTGRAVTHTGLGWMGGLALRMVLAFNVAELGRTVRKTELAAFSAEGSSRITVRFLF